MVAKLYGPLFSQYLRSGVTVGASVLFAFNIVGNKNTLRIMLTVFCKRL